MNSATQAGASQKGEPRASGSALDPDLISAIHGLDADRDRAVAFRTRRVVMNSGGILKEQKHIGSRARAFALAATILVLLLVAPLAWEAADSLIAGEHLADPGSQLSLWACIVCPTMLAAALVAGWWKHRS